MDTKLPGRLSAHMATLTSIKGLVRVTGLLLIISPAISQADTRSYEAEVRQQCAAMYHRESDYEKCAMRAVRPPQINSFLDHDSAYRAQPFAPSQSLTTPE